MAAFWVYIKSSLTREILKNSVFFLQKDIHIVQKEPVNGTGFFETPDGYCYLKHNKM